MSTPSLHVTEPFNFLVIQQKGLMEFELLGSFLIMIHGQRQYNIFCIQLQWLLFCEHFPFCFWCLALHTGCKEEQLCVTY